METAMTGISEARPQRRRGISRVARVAGNVLFYCVLVLMLFLVIFLVQSRLMDGPPRVFGHELYVVLGGSMSPAFEAGSLVGVRPVDPSTLRAGDVISFRTREGSMLTTHRIVAVDTEGGLSFTTKGDANDAVDPNPVPAHSVIGKVSLAVPYAGYVVRFADTLQGLLILVIIPGALIIAFEVHNLFTHARKTDRQKAPAGDADSTRAGPSNEGTSGEA